MPGERQVTAGAAWTATVSAATACLAVASVVGAAAFAAIPNPGGGVSMDLRSNRFAAPDGAEGREPPGRSVPAGYRLVARSPVLELYADEKALGVAVRDLRTGYVWTSVPREEDLRQARLNPQWQAAARSPFVMEYFDASARRLRGSLLSLGGSATEVHSIGNGFRAVYSMAGEKLGLTLEVRLEGDQMVVRVPNASLVENGTSKWAAIQIFPFLGAVLRGTVPGYLFIPDGSGALIRFQETQRDYDEPFRGAVYGSDPAIERPPSRRHSLPPQPVLAPVFGVVHGVGRNAFTAILEAGAFNAEILAYPSGVVTPFYWVAASFVLRQPYFQPTSKNMGGINTFQRERNGEDLQLRYRFLAGDDADYVGMARTYREYLRSKGRLPGRVRTDAAGGSETVPLRLEVLGAERARRLIGSRALRMTSFDAVGQMVESLRASGVERMVVVVKGWNRGGLHASNPDTFPVEAVVGGEAGLERLVSRLKAYGYPLYLYANYTMAFGRNGNFVPRRDAARSISNGLLQTGIQSSGLEEWISAYLIRPVKAAELAARDAAHFRRLGISGVALDKTGLWLFSDYGAARPMGRPEAAGLYSQLVDTLRREVGSVAAYVPNDYLLPHIDRLFDIPMYSSQYIFETDTVPFLQTVLHGSVEYFAPFANYTANQREYMLRMVEYGAYPSYLLTFEPSWKLRNTLSDWLYASYFPDWKDEVAVVYRRVNEALGRVRGASVARRRVIDWGLVETVYDNGVHIAVNYRADEASVGPHRIPPRDFLTWKGGT